MLLLANRLVGLADTLFICNVQSGIPGCSRASDAAYNAAMRCALAAMLANGSLLDEREPGICGGSSGVQTTARRRALAVPAVAIHRSRQLRRSIARSSAAVARARLARCAE